MMQFREYLSIQEKAMVNTAGGRWGQAAQAVGQGALQVGMDIVPGAGVVGAVADVASKLWGILKGANADQQILSLMAQPDTERAQNPLAMLDVDDNVWNSLSDTGKNYMRDLLKAALQRLQQNQQQPPPNIGNQTVKGGLTQWANSMQ